MNERGHLDLLKGFVTIEGSCLVPQRIAAGKFRQHPYMALKGDYSATSEVCQTMVD
jgi:hypothetical protein